MIGKWLAGVGTWQCAVLCFGLLTGISAQPAAAADCPGHPDALGTSRTLVVDPREHPRIGTMQYAETLPLEDHEVVLTFDDGPLRRNSPQVLEILAAQCVKATFFIIGSMARENPEGVRKVRDAGHSIGTHSQNHPLTFHKMSVEHAMQEIDDGIASVTAALGDGAAPAPFFRIPGLLRAEGIEEYLASQGIQTWSADFPADDWRHISSSRVYELAIDRLEAKGKGILLLHDIQARTVAALPRILHELKARGYRIVHVVPATPELPATPTEPQQWQLHPPSETVAISHWPQIPNFVFAKTDPLPAPVLSDSYWHDEWPIPVAETSDRSKRRGNPLPRQSPWPRQTPLPPEHAAIALPAPARSVFEMQDRLRFALARTPQAAKPAIATGARQERDGAKPVASDGGPSRRTVAGKLHLGRVRHASAAQAAGRAIRNATHAGRRTLKRMVQAKKRSV
jgi:peptidoglycan/xylan/chitin deacetylase (PgdA/CDA1 family)